MGEDATSLANDRKLASASASLPPASVRPSTDANGAPNLSRFRIVRRLGEGGMGVVYEAIDLERGARVALKTLRRLDGDLLLRLKDEFRALQDVDHPGLVHLGELLCDEGTWLFTMELVDGVDLLTHVRTSEDPFSFDEARLRASLVRLAAGLRALHAAGKIHRDIKPSNILAARDGRVVLLDFGLVRDAATASHDRAGYVVGTIHYMAPEQAAGREVSAAADLYAVGVVLYECLTGKRPFEGAAGQVLTKKQNDDPIPPRSLAQAVPADLDALCMALLARSPHARPSATEMLLQLADSAPRGSLAPAELDAPAPSQSLGRAFVGRDREVRLLLEAWNRLVVDKHASTILIEGESGVGKSTLVRKLTRTLPSLHKRAILLAGRCYEREAVPFKAVDGVVDALSRALERLDDAEVAKILPPNAWLLAHVFPVLRRVPAFGRLAFRGQADVDAHESRSRLFIALRELLRMLAESRPLVMVIDDLHWADVDSLALLAELTRPPYPPRMLFVATAQIARTTLIPRAPTSSKSGASLPPSAPPSLIPPPMPESLALTGDVTTVSLGRLAHDDAVTLAEVLLSDAGVADRRLVEIVAAEGDGHPLFLDELARHVRLGGAPHTRGQLDAALAARTRTLEPEAKLLLDLLVVAGVALPTSTAMRAASLDFAALMRHASSLRALHLARTRGDRGEDVLEPYHDRVRSAVTAGLDAATRRALHERLALAYEAEGNVDPEAVAAEWEASGDRTRAGGFALEAAHRAFGALAFERAAELYAQALESAGLDESTRHGVMVKRGAALANAGRAVEAAHAYLEAAARAGAEQALDLRRCAAEEMLIAGKIEEGVAMLRIVLATVGVALPKTPFGGLVALLVLRLRIVLRGIGFRERPSESLNAAHVLRFDACWGVARVLNLVDTIRGAYLQSRALLYALDLGEPVRVSLSLSLDAAWRASAGVRPARTASALARADALAQRESHATASGTALGASSAVAYFSGHFREALSLADRAHELLRARAPAAFWEQRTTATLGIWALQWMGHLDELARRVELSLAFAEHRGDLYATATFSLGRASYAWLRTDDVEQTRAVIARAAGGLAHAFGPGGYQVPTFAAMIARTEVDLYEGNGAAAHARVVEDFPKLRRALMLRVPFLRVEAIELRARTACAAARDATGSARRELVAVAQRDARHLAAQRAPYARALGLLHEAGVHHLEGDASRAERALTESIVAFDAAAMGLHAASARHHLGHLRGGDDGRALIATAEAWMGTQGVVRADRMAATIAPAFRPRVTSEGRST